MGRERKESGVLFSQALGAGPDAIVLLHGFMGSGRNLRTLAQRWSERDPALRFLMLDLTGHGRSPALPEGADLSTLARDVVQTARAEGIAGKLRIVGHSLGGRVGLQAILDVPDEVGAVVLLDVAPGPVDPRWETGPVLEALRSAPARAQSRDEIRAHFAARGLSQGHAEWLLTNLVRDGEEFVWRIDREALAALHARTRDADLWDALEAGVPVRCIRGGASPFVTEADVFRMETLGCPVETVAGADHYLHVTHTEEVAARLANAGIVR